MAKLKSVHRSRCRANAAPFSLVSVAQRKLPTIRAPKLPQGVQ